jgi:hypothetical protein
VYRSGLGRWHASSIFDSDIVNKEVLARFIDAVSVLVNNVEFDNLKGIGAWVCSL